MDINSSSVAVVVTDPNQKAEATITAYPIFDVLFDMEDMSKNQFIFQVIARILIGKERTIFVYRKI